jgi:hypothetical protein
MISKFVNYSLRVGFVWISLYINSCSKNTSPLTGLYIHNKSFHYIDNRNSDKVAYDGTKVDEHLLLKADSTFIDIDFFEFYQADDYGPEKTYTEGGGKYQIINGKVNLIFDMTFKFPKQEIKVDSFRDNMEYNLMNIPLTKRHSLKIKPTRKTIKLDDLIKVTGK